MDSAYSLACMGHQWKTQVSMRFWILIEEKVGLSSSLSSFFFPLFWLSSHILLLWFQLYREDKIDFSTLCHKYLDPLCYTFHTKLMDTIDGNMSIGFHAYWAFWDIFSGSLLLLYFLCHLNIMRKIKQKILLWLQ